MNVGDWGPSSFGELTRRDALKRAALAGAAISVPWTIPERALAADPLPKTLGWVDDGHKVTRPPSDANVDTLQWVTVMRVSDKLGAPLNRWYLWVWTHNGGVLRLYTANQARGPYTASAITCSLPAPPAGCRPNSPSTGYNDMRGPNSGDIVWDPVGNRFLACPHYQRATGGRIDTFLLQSADGVNWTLVSPTPIIRAGTAGFSREQASYPRFLRDYSGNVIRHPTYGVIIFYRGEVGFPPNGPLGTDTRKDQYGGAWSTDPALLAWSQNSSPLFNGNEGQNLIAGSALYVNGLAHLVMCTHDASTPFGTGPVSMWLKQATADVSPWSAGMGSLMYRHTPPTHDGGSYFIDDDGAHGMAFVVGPPRGTASTGLTWNVDMVVAPV